ncbi:hypothetical protein LENED_007415 [Lentinula edodes]|uniref:Chromo domain-containing protein n=1 Tax=Lentinula edodes TaxID=5353 RepID=A0A1Q3EEF6_LENED|nr:hypothetical protein LENED_007415 [Lentinula edodes]
MGAPPKKKARLEEDSAESDEEVFQVEYFKAAKVDEDGEWLYLVKWHGYDNPKDDTWEPQEYIANCQRLLASFWKEIGGDDEDYYPGYNCTPSEAWINKEKIRFARKNPDAMRRVAAQKAKAAERDRKKEQRRQKQKLVIAKAATQETSKAPTSTQESKRPSSSMAVKVRVKEEYDRSVTAPKTISKSMPKLAIQPEASSDSEPDIPIMKMVKKTRRVEQESSSPDSSEAEPPSVKGKRKRPNVKARSTAEETEPPRYMNPGPSNLSLQTETKLVNKNKPSLPRLRTARPASGPSNTTHSTSLPTLAKLKTPTPSLLKPTTEGSASAGGNAFMKTPTQGALKTDALPEKDIGGSRPHLPRKSTSTLNGISFKKNRGGPMKESQTIIADRASPKNVPTYSHRAEPSSPAVVSATPTPRHFSRPKMASEDQVPSSQKTLNNPTNPQVEPFVPLASTSEAQPSDDWGMDPSAADLNHLPPISSRRSSMLNDEAESFLSSVMPMTKTAGVEYVLPKSESRISSKTNAIWAGKLILEIDEIDEAQTMSMESLLLASDPSAGQISLTQGVIPLKVSMSYNDSKLVMKSRSFYRFEDLNAILAACSPVKEWGWLCAAKEEEARKFRQIADLLSHKKWVAFIPVAVEEKVVAINLIYPSTLSHHYLPPVKSFVPNETALIVSLHNWVINAEDCLLDDVLKHFVQRLDNAYDRRDFKLPRGVYEAYGEPGIKPLEGLLVPKLTTKHAVRMLELPELLHSYLVSGGERPFALWPPVDSEVFGLSPVSEIEREMLSTLLNEYPATVNQGTVGTEWDSSLRVIFAHVNSLVPSSGWRDIRDIPGLSEYRMMNDVRFFVYGSSDIVNPRFSDIIEEIWHIGGLVTFTPNALLSDPLGVHERILQIEEHDFWACYILPAVIGMAVSIAYRDREHVIQKRIACKANKHVPHCTGSQSIDVDIDIGIDEPISCTCDGLGYEWLLDAIDEELISIVGAPPLQTHLGGQGAVTRRGASRDNRLRNTEDWNLLSENHSTSSSFLTYLDTPSSSLPLSFIAQDQLGCPPSSIPVQYDDSFVPWIFQLFDSDVRDRSETLAFCVREFMQLCGNLPQEEWEDAIKREIIEHLGRLQISRGFREELRRFVIVTGSEDKGLQTDQSGIEWATVESFRFQDVTDVQDIFDLF